MAAALTTVAMTRAQSLRRSMEMRGRVLSHNFLLDDCGRIRWRSVPAPASLPWASRPNGWAAFGLLGPAAPPTLAPPSPPLHLNAPPNRGMGAPDQYGFQKLIEATDSLIRGT